MQQTTKEILTQILRDTIKAVKKQDLTKLRATSEKLAKNASIYQNKYAISISVVVYSLFKILEKENYLQNENYPTIKKIILTELNNARNAIRKDKPYILQKSLKKIIASLKKLDKQAGQFIQESLESSKIKKAYGLYKHGISTGKAAELLGITRWELQPYLGKTRESEQLHNLTKPVSQRIKLAKEIFNIR